MRAEILVGRERRRWSADDELQIVREAFAPGARVTPSRQWGGAAAGRVAQSDLPVAGLAALAQQVKQQNPASGAVLAFPRRRGDRIKLLMRDGQGFCLYYKVLERGHFPWPSPADGVARLTAGQLAKLWEGIDWWRPAWTAPPSRVA